jgi:hypothetical protein
VQKRSIRRGNDLYFKTTALQKLVEVPVARSVEKAFNLICALIPFLFKVGLSGQTGCLSDGNITRIKVAIADNLNLVDRAYLLCHELKYR